MVHKANASPANLLAEFDRADVAGVGRVISFSVHDTAGTDQIKGSIVLLDAGAD
jgi:hypothetical protein